MLNPGRYHAKLVRLDLGTTGTGSSQVIGTWNIISHWNEQTGQWEGVSEERRTYWVIGGGATDYTEAKLDAIGFNWDWRNLQAGKEAKADGRELACRHETYQGKTGERWDLADWYAPQEIAPPSEVAIKQLEEMFKDRAGGKPKDAARPPRTSQPAGPSAGESPSGNQITPVDEEDIPF